jgi:hypothetical protein
LKLINHILYLEFAEMVLAGVSEGYLKKAKSVGTSCWTFIKDPDDSRRVLIQYEKLKPKYKELIIKKYGNPYQYIAINALDKHIQPNTEARMYYTNYILPTGKALSTEYIEKYTQCAELLHFLCEARGKNGKKTIKQIAPDVPTFWQMVAEYIDKKGIELPKTYARLLEKIRQFKAEDGTKNYEIVISGKFGNSNTEKINDAAAQWVIAQYSMPTTTLNTLFSDYNIEAKANGWKPLQHSNTLYQFLQREDVVQEWFLGRYGENRFKERFGYQLRTILPSVRDALWYGDGTKLNYYFINEDGKASTMMVYEVVDVYSECLLGFSVAPTEQYAMQYEAYKMAIQFAGQKPFEIRYDNQGGHKKIKDSFLGKLSRIGFACQPYNGKSKTIESIFGRFQSEYLKRDWFFTGQNITAKKLDSTHNREFIAKNAKHLPTKDEVIKAYEKRRNEWNNAKHPKYNLSRIECYKNSINEKAQPVDYLEMVEMFWLTTEKAITYYNSGITITVAKEKYEYEVLKNGMPDSEFRSKNIDAKFFVKYDPVDLSHIRLYKKTHNGIEFITIAEPRLRVHRATQEHEVGEKTMINQLLDVRKNEVANALKRHRQREAETGISIYNQIIPSYGQMLKAESNLLAEDEDYDLSEQL